MSVSSAWKLRFALSFSIQLWIKFIFISIQQNPSRTIDELLQKFLPPFATRRFIVRFTRDHHWTVLNLMNGLHNLNITSLRSILILSSHMLLYLPNSLYPLKFQRMSVCTSSFLSVLPAPSILSSFLCLFIN